MEIKKDDFERAINQLTSKVETFTCPYCGRSTGIELYHDSFYEMGPGSEKEMMADFNKGVRIPCICGCCLNCGYILKFSLDRLLR